MNSGAGQQERDAPLGDGELGEAAHAGSFRWWRAGRGRGGDGGGVGDGAPAARGERRERVADQGELGVVEDARAARASGGR